MNEKAVAVANDVLKHLKALQITQGTYADMKEGGLEVFASDDDLQQYLDVIQKHCHVCLLGACVLSKARIYDKVTMSQFRQIESVCDEVKIREMLEDVFDRDTINLMEAAFEGDRFCWMKGTDLEQIDAAILFGEKYGDSKERIAAAMKNVIKNSGKFIP